MNTYMTLHRASDQSSDARVDHRELNREIKTMIFATAAFLLVAASVFQTV